MMPARILRKSFVFFLAIILTAFVFAACGEKTEARGREDLRKGKAAYEIGKYDEATMSFSLAAQDGSAEAMYLLGRCYQDGTGVERDIDKAEQWMKKAAEQGHAEAKLFLASIDKAFSATCELIRQEISYTESDILSLGYVSVPKSSIEKLFKSRAVLEKTVKRLSLPYSYEQLYNKISVTSDKNGDYFVVTAFSKDPVLAAKLANTLSEVFIDEYKKLFRRHLEDLNDNCVKTLNTLERELAEKNEMLEHIYATNNISDIDNDIAYNTQQLLLVEDQLRRTSAALESSKQALHALQGELANTPEDIVTHRETSTVMEDELRQAQDKLSEYEQMYAKSNPVLLQQRELVNKLRAELEKKKQEDENGENDFNRRIVISRNPVYSQINVSIATKKAEIAALNNEIRLNNEAAIQLRARRELLTKNQTEIRQIMDDIEQSKKQISGIKNRIATIRSFLDRSFSDISILKFAKASDNTK